MGTKKLPKDVDLATSVDVAAGFFSTPSNIASNKENIPVTTTHDVTEPEQISKQTTVTPKKNLGGRPKKEGLKNEQFTLTMNPEMYEKLRIIAEEYTIGNFSGLIDEAIKSFCRENSIDLSAIHVPSEIMDMYKKKQEKKSKRK